MLRPATVLAMANVIMGILPRTHWPSAVTQGAVQWLALTLLILGSARTARAQQPAPGQPEGVLFGEIPAVTVASRFAQNADEAPASVTVITAEEIARQGWRTLGEALQSVRGFYVTYDRNYTYLGVRGFGQPGDYSTRVLVLLDGQRLNDNIYGLVYFGTESPVEIDLVERLEVIRGPGASLYGNGALFGVVNVVTRRGRDVRGAELAGAMQSYGGRQARVSLGTRFRSGLEVMASGSLYRSAGQDLYFPEYDDSTTNFGRAVNLDRDRRDHASLKLSRGRLTLVSNYSRRNKQIPTGSFGTIFNDPRGQSTDQFLTVALQYAGTVGERAKVNTALSYNSYEYVGDYPFPGSLFRDFASGRWWVAEGNYVRRLGRAQQLVLGGEYHWNTRQDQGAKDATSGTPYFRDNTRSDKWAVFAQDELRLSPRLLLNAGVQYDHDPGFNGTLNPRLGLIYHHAGSAVKLLGSRGFRAPSNFERFYIDGQIQKQATGLVPEDIWTIESVVERQFARHWRVSLSGYQYRISNLITNTVDPTDSVSVFRNLGRINAQGAEVEFNGELTGLGLRASYGLQRAEDGTGANLGNSPRHMVKLGMWRALFRERLTLGAEMNALSQRTAANGGRVPGYAVVNLTLRTQNWPRGCSAGLSAYNLFDRAYGDPVSDDHLQTAIPQNRRNFRATLRFGF